MIQTQEAIVNQQKEIKVQNVELEEKNASLRELNRTKDLFLSIISHDLRSPFNSLLGLTEILILNREKIKNPEMIRLVDSIHESAKQAYKLVLNLLEWSKLQSDRIEYSPVHLNLKKVAAGNIELIKIQAQNKGIEVILEKGGENCYVNADDKLTTKGTLGEIGTGLGLVLCNEFASRNGGKIDAESEVNKGSMFTLSLPTI